MNTNTASLKVLTVDDSQIVSENLGEMLNDIQNINWIGHAFTLSDAYLHIIEKEPEVIILDIQMKEESGFELLEFLKQKHPEIQVMMFTNLSYLPYRKKSIELGAKYFLDKSTEFEKIPEILTAILNNKQNDN
ncbi:MAG: Response regulator GacA [Bacteroidia bacterium]|nr:Response regulator GacA [Bacteroidia bacterium]